MKGIQGRRYFILELALLVSCVLRLSAAVNVSLNLKDVFLIPDDEDPFGNLDLDLEEDFVEALDFDPKTRTILAAGDERVNLFRLEKDLTLTRLLEDHFEDIVFQQVKFCGKFWILTGKNERVPLNGRLMIFKRYNPKVGFLEMAQNFPVGGHSPNDIAVSKDCKKILVTVEGPPFYAPLARCDKKGKRRKKRGGCSVEFNPPGFILKVEFKTSDLCKRFRTTRLDFGAFNSRISELEEEGFFHCDRSVPLSDDVEPESICLNKRGTRAYVTLQENNAIAEIKCRRKGKCEIVRIKGLGFKDFNLPGNGFDASDEDGQINIANWPVKGLRQPDQIRCITVGKQEFLITANEGAFRGISEGSKNETSKICKVKQITLDPEVFPNAAELQMSENLGELWIFRNLGDMDGDGDYDMLFASGTRDASIWDTDLNLIAHTADDFEQLSAEVCPQAFNADPGRFSPISESFDSESNERGIEIESLAVFPICKGSHFAQFTGYENPGGIFVSVLDASNLASGFQIQQHVTGILDKDSDLVWEELYELRQLSLLHVEALRIVSAKFSPSGKPLLLAGAQHTSSINVYEINVECDQMSSSSSSWF